MTTTISKVIDEMSESLQGAARAFYSNSPGYWDENTDEFVEAFEEAYQGEFESDETFAEEMAESTGAYDFTKVSWPLTCVDWAQAARELMFDYFEINGYYFRSL
jgi:antirestriction protein